MVCRDGLVAVMAEDAIVGDGALAIDMVRRIVTGGHPPIAALFRIPGDRQLQQTSVGRTMQISARMNARAEEVVDLRLLDIGALAFVTDLVAELKVIGAAPDHF